MSPQQKTICVVIDTNIWVKDSNLLLNTAIGSALFYILKSVDGKIGLPSILEEEITRHIIEDGVAAAESIQKSFKTISIIMGKHYSYTVPNEAEISSAVQARITELKTLLHKIPFTLPHAESALKKINENLPPNGKNNQQFKDSAIWEAILELIGLYTVHFVTADKAFYKEKQYQNGLATNLHLDCQQRGGEVYIYPDMASCLKVIQNDMPPLDTISLISEIDNKLKSRLKIELLRENGFEVSSLARELSFVSPFFTENSNELALTFELCYDCCDVQNIGIDERLQSVLKVKGDCFYALDTNLISELALDYQRIYWADPSGELQRRGSVYLSSMQNSDLVKHTFREPIDFIRSPELSAKQRRELLLKKKTSFFQNYSEDEKAILLIFLDEYAEIGSSVVFRHPADTIMKSSELTQYGDVIQMFGGQEKLDEALKDLQNHLYSV
ncbi:PIN domain-containing protein [Microcoleus sp. w2-18bC1]